MRVIRDLDELDRQLMRLDELHAVSDAALREGFNEFRMDIPMIEGLDPDSEEYRNQQLAIHEHLAGKRYSPVNEVSHFDVASATSRPFPYYTEGWEVIGDQLIAVGFIVKTMKLAAKSTILEFGPGWGNTTIALARSGYDVTCIEIEKNFVDLVRERANRKQLSINAIQGDFLDAAKLDRRFDAVLFFECFHHCWRHNELLDLLENLINPGGIVVFAAEPITDDFHTPWGVRMDGQTLWAIRKFGWMELGFTETYFRSSLERRGWQVEKHHCAATSVGTIFVARRAPPLVPSDSVPVPRAEPVAAEASATPAAPLPPPAAPAPMTLGRIIRGVARRARRLLR